MRYLILLLFVFVIQSLANQSPRYQLLVDSTIDKKSLTGVVTEPIKIFKEKGVTLKPASEPRKSKGIITSVSYPLQPIDSTKIIILPESQPRSMAGSLYLYDTPETPIDSARLHALTFDSSTLEKTSLIIDSTKSDDTDDNTPSNVGSTKVGKGDLVGIASWYGPGFQGKKTASGDRFDENKLTAAHRTLPFGTIVEVTSLKTGKAVRVKINDRGPFSKKRLIDLSTKAASNIGLVALGHGKVKLKVIN